MDAPSHRPAEADTDSGDGFQARRSPRMPVDEAVTLRLESGGVADAVVGDLSVRGFMARTVTVVPIGSYVAIDLPGVGPLQAQVRWQMVGKLGARFIEPVSIHRCAWLHGLVDARTRED